MDSGIETAIIDKNARIGDGALCTWFVAPSDPVTAKKRWIAGQLEPKGSVTVDAGAEKALNQGKSLLPAGVTRVEGEFERGDAVLAELPAVIERARAAGMAGS